MTWRSRLLVIWGYASEILLAALLTVVVRMLVPGSTLKLLLVDNASAWTTVFTILFAARTALWGVFINIATKPFGPWLHKRGALKVFQHALSSPLLIFAAGIVSCIAMKAIQNQYTLFTAVFFIFYGTINLITMITNTIQIVDLYVLFEKDGSKK